jgi:outer membrane protein TolC
MFTISSRRPPLTSPARESARLALLVAAAMFAAFAHGQPPLSLDQALRMAQERSQLVVAQGAAAAAARDLAVAAGRLPDPTLKLGINNLPVDGPDAFSLTRDFMTMGSIGVMQEFTRADKREARSVRFEREADTAEAGRAVAIADLRRDTAMAWLDRYYRERMREVLSIQRDEAVLQIEATEAAYRGGRGSQADVFAARSAVAQIDDRLQRNTREILLATTRLTRWVGAEAAQPLAPLTALPALQLESRDLDTAIARHPRIELLQRQEDLARADAEVARSNKNADWSVELMYSQRGPAYSNMISLNVAIPLQWDQTNRQDRQLAARLALVEQQRAQREESAREYEAQIRGWIEEWESNRSRLTHYAAALIPLAGERTQAALAAYRGGAGSLAAVLEARRAQIDTQLERLAIEMDNAQLWARIEYSLAPLDMAANGLSNTASRATAKER